MNQLARIENEHIAVPMHGSSHATTLPNARYPSVVMLPDPDIVVCFFSALPNPGFVDSW